MAASHGADCSTECCLYRRIGAFGLRRSHRCLAISGGPRWSSVDTVPRHRLRSRVHPLVSLALLLSSSCLRRPEHPSPACAGPTTTGAFLGVHNLFATTALRVHVRQASQAHLVPPSAFHTLSTAYSSQRLADLFHPAATSRFRAPGVSSLVPAVPPRRWPLPPRRWRRPPVTGCPVTPAGVASTSRS
jgi:hypothetical protein